MITRKFFNWDRPFLWQVEEYLFNNILKNTEYDDYAIHLITPSLRSNRRLTEIICAKAETLENTIFDFEVNLLSELPLIFNKQKLLSRTESLIYWHEALEKSKDNQAANSIFLIQSQEDPVFFLESLRKTLSSILKKPSDIISTIKELYPDINTDSWLEIDTIWRNYEEILKSNGTADSYSHFYEPPKSLLPNNKTIIVFIGCTEISLFIEESLLNSSMDIVSLIPAPEIHSMGFNEFGRLDPAYWSKHFPKIGNQNLVFTDSDAKQLELVKSELCLLKASRYPEEMICLVSLDPSIIGPLQAAISETGHTAVIPGAKTLKNSSLGKLVLDTAQIFTLGKIALPTLIQHPIILEFLKSSSILLDPNSIIEDLDTIRVDTTEANFIITSDQTQTTKDRIRATQDLIKKTGFIKLSNEITPQQYIKNLKSILAIILREIKNEGQLLYSHEELRKLGEVFDEISGICPSQGKTIQISILTSILSELLYAEDLAGENIKGIEVLGLLESHFDDSQVCYFLNAVEGFLPQKPSLDPLLPNNLKKHLGLQDSEVREANINLFLNSLISSKQLIKFIIPRITFSGDSTRLPKQLVLGNPETLESVLTEFYQSTNDESVINQNTFIGNNLINTKSDDVIFLLESISATKIKTYLRCPYLFYLQYILNIDYIDYEPLELSNLKVGEILHSLFDKTHKFSDKNPRITESELDLFCDELFHTTCVYHLGNNPTIPVKLQLALLQRKFRSYVKWHQNSIRLGWNILESELAFVNDWEITLKNKSTIKFKGTIDRIDFNQRENKLRVIDFKTGDKPYEFKDAKKKSGWIDPQLPLYAKFIRQNIFSKFQLPEDATIELTYVSLPKSSHVIESTYTYTPELGEEVLALAKSVAESIQQNIFWPPRVSSDLINRIFGTLNENLLIEDDSDEEEAT